jgi:hypothetical protein
MTDLDQAIETITEGGQALGVSCEDVYREIANNKCLVVHILEDIHRGEDLSDRFFKLINRVSERLLKEALRTELEQGAGL